MPPTPEGGLPPILATSSRNGSKELDRLRCEGLPLAPKKQKKIIKFAPKTADFYKVVFSSFFVITFLDTIGGIDTQRVTEANYEFFGTFWGRITSFSEPFTSFSELFGEFYDYLTTSL